jgi:hypothetical protein
VPIALQLSATSSSGATLTYSASGLPAGLNIDPSTGLISGTLATASASATPYQVTASVTDGTNSATQSFQWTVNFISLTNPGDQFSYDGDEVSLSVAASDASGQALTLSAAGIPPGLSINSQTDLISGTLSTTADTNSPYSVTLTATDGTYQASQSFSWYVSPQTPLSLDPPGDQFRVCSKSLRGLFWAIAAR